MRLMDRLDCVAGNFMVETETVKGKKQAVRLATVEDCEKFKEYLLIHELYEAMYNSIESWKVFYNIVPLFNEAFDKAVQKDVFYAVKLDYLFKEGIPSELVYILTKAVNKYDTPNRALSAIDQRILNRYLVKDALPDGITVKDVLENIYGKPVQLLGKATYSAKNGNTIEVCISDVDRVLVLPLKLGETLKRREDVESLRYDEELGVCIKDVPLRTLLGSSALCTDDFDLRTLYGFVE